MALFFTTEKLAMHDFNFFPTKYSRQNKMHSTHTLSKTNNKLKRIYHCQGVHGAMAKAIGWGAPTQGSNPGCGTLFWIYSRIFWRYALSGRRRAPRQRGLRELQNLPAQSFEGAHRGRVCVRVFIGVSVRTC